MIPARVAERAAAQRTESASQCQQQKVRRHGLWKEAEPGPDVAFVFQAVELRRGNQRGEQAAAAAVIGGSSKQRTMMKKLSGSSTSER